MKYLKILGLAAMSAMVLMAFVGVGSASAKEGVLCSTATNPCTSKWPVGTKLDFSLEPGTSATLETTEHGLLVTCTKSTVKGELTANPDATGTATGKITELTWGATVEGKCPALTGGDVIVKTTVPGALKVEAEDDNGNGNLYSDAQIKVTINIFGSCEYGVEPGTKLGTWNEATQTFTANTVAKRLNFCLGPETAFWSGKYIKTEPSSTTLYVSTK